MTKTVQAFEGSALLTGNKGLAVDHPQVAAKVRELLGQMNQAQKIHEIRGHQIESFEGLFHAGGDPALGIPAYRMVDGPRGARVGKATAFPVAIARAATFDPELEWRVGKAIGAEVAAKGGNVLLAPTINLLRHPGWGRAQETYSEDTCHMGAMAVAFVSGVQNHVLSSPKHFALNNLENTRFTLSANIDERSLHEVYLPHFKRCVTEAAAASVMSAYNKVNGVYCGEHRQLLTEILRDDWGFRGFVESDWILGTRSTADALKSGLDIEMPAPYRFSDENLSAALADGSLTEADIDRAAGNALYQKVAWQLDQVTPVDAAVVECAEHIALAREAAEKSLVLLKNDDALLPLQDSAELKLAIVGDLAAVANLGDRGSSMVESSEVTTPLAGIQALATQSHIEFFPSDANFDALADFDLCMVVTGLTFREEGEFIPTAQLESEQGALARGGDRTNLQLPEQEQQLLRRVTAAAKKTLVLLEGGSAVQVNDWLDDVDALLMVWYPGREGGHAIARVLFGEVNPSGRLPVTVPKSMRQLPDWDVTAEDVPHDLLHGYRYLDHHGESPQFPFGFGLSYTNFELSSLHSQRTAGGFELQVEVTNTGEIQGATVVQVYMSCEESAVFRVPKELKHFARVSLEVGETVILMLNISDKELAYYDAEQHGWQLEQCIYNFRLGFSAGEQPLSNRWRYSAAGWSTAN